MNKSVQNARPQTEAVSASGRAKRSSRASLRTNDPDRTRADIIAVAMREFSEKGLAGARVDEIAALTKTSKRMIYYYFESKEGLYLAVLEESYRAMREIESGLLLDSFEPQEALRRLVAFTVEYQFQHPEFIRLVMTENIHRGQYLASSRAIQKLNVPAIDGLRRVYERGVASGVFRAGIDLVDLHMSISALSIFNVANQHTFGLIFKRDMGQKRWLNKRSSEICELILRYVAAQ
jgi:AcrR family transcriptional regulator